MAPGQWPAALLDAPAAPWPQVAWWCAAVKFTLVLLGLAYAAWGGVWAAKRFGEPTKEVE